MGEPSTTGGGCSSSLACTAVVSRRRLCVLRLNITYIIWPTHLGTRTFGRRGTVHRYAATIFSASYSPAD
jgi:hypothetical protein